MQPLAGNILITGGSGFLGRGILKRAITTEQWDARFTVFSRDEYKQDECRRRYPSVRYLLGDVADEAQLEMAMAGQDVVIHAAALKYVPEAESNVQEAIRVNILGSQAVLRAASRAGVKTVIMLSTDKAVRPVSLYGMTKAVMERLASDFAQKAPHMRVVTVRYGNVVGSTGSVIPLFQRQMGEGLITLTDPAMTRFWISINDAIDLILVANEQCQSGEIYVARLQAMSMGELVKALAAKDTWECPVKVIGERPGEKHHEELMHYQESVRVVRSDGTPRYREAYRLTPTLDHAPHSAFTLSSEFTNADRLSHERMQGMIAEAIGV